MTKTLTEQWREGTLARGDYYIKTTGLGIDEIIINYYEEELKQFDGLCNCSVAEVLAHVPSYEKWKNMDDLLLIYKKENKRLKAVKEHCENVAGQYADKLVDTERNVELLEKKLAIATRALEDIKEHTKELSLPSYTGMLCDKALKEMEGVK